MFKVDVCIPWLFCWWDLSYGGLLVVCTDNSLTVASRWSMDGYTGGWYMDEYVAGWSLDNYIDGP